MFDIGQVSVTPGGDPAILSHAFVMLGAEVQEPDAELDGYYDPASQTWIGGRRLGLGSYSNRSNGSKGGYSYQSDD